MKPQTIVLREMQQFDRAVHILKAMPSEPLCECIIRLHKSNISVRQRSYYWVVLKAIEEHTGTTSEDLHLDYKKRFLVDIFSRNVDDHPGYGEMMESLRAVYARGMQGHAKRFYDYVVQMTSIMDANVDEMVEFIDKIIIAAAQELHFAVPPAENDIMRRT